ncbi:universal stress protein [Natribaculum luteum]|uniref:Universal stress protein n=1 Tax=Natribaculum luteum TaxID=1586232 RepID=A0ABD5NW13_9EURY|nr:universal stress protein [Natribaculum luteum]
MVSRVLVPMDDSEMAERALEYALEVHDDADVTVLNVVGVPSPFMGEAVSIALEEDVEEAAARRAVAVLDRAEELAAERGREIDTDVDVGRPARAIVERADDFDVVVLGSHGGDAMDRLYVGNVAKTVFERSPVPVTVVR